MPDRLDEVLRQAQDLGLFGPGPVDAQRTHAEAFCRLVIDALGEEPARWLDLGSGGGLPGLVLAGVAPRSTGVLLDSRQRRGAFLEQAVESLGLAHRVQAVTARAEDAARDPDHRERYDLVVARSFGTPAVTAESATALLRPTAVLAVSEPPESAPDRWDTDQLRALGFQPPDVVSKDGATAALLRRTADPVASKWPRRPGIPQKRPLW